MIALKTSNSNVVALPRATEKPFSQALIDVVEVDGKILATLADGSVVETTDAAIAALLDSGPYATYCVTPGWNILTLKPSGKVEKYRIFAREITPDGPPGGSPLTFRKEFWDRLALVIESPFGKYTGSRGHQYADIHEVRHMFSLIYRASLAPLQSIKTV